MKVRSRIWLALTVLYLVVPGRARADGDADSRAAREFQHGQEAFEAADFRVAARAFEAAYAAKPHYDALFNAGQAWQRAGDEIRAANLLERYLREAPADAKDRVLAQGVLADVTRHAGRIHVTREIVRRPAVDGD